MNSMRLGLLFVAALACSAVALAQESPINSECPVMQGEPIDPAITTVYKGKTIAFCCDRCLAKFEGNPEKYVGRIAGWPAVEESSTTSSSDDGQETTAQDEADESVTGAAPSKGGQPDAAGDEATENDAAAGEDVEMSFAGRVHPALVHVPIAALPIALIAFLAWLASGKRSFSNADAIPLLIGALVAVPTYLTGREAEAGQRFSKSMHTIAEQHESAGLVVMVLALALAVIRLWRWNRLTGTWMWVYGTGLVVASAVVGITGWLGGKLVFGPDHLSWSL